MAQSESSKRKEELSTLLDSKRRELTQARDALTKKLSVSGLLKHSVKKHPLPWFAGSLGSATLVTLLLRRPKSSKPRRRGLLFTLLKFGFSMAKPTLIKWGVERLKSQAQQQFLQQRRNSKLGEEI